MAKFIQLTHAKYDADTDQYCPGTPTVTFTPVVIVNVDHIRYITSVNPTQGKNPDFRGCALVLDGNDVNDLVVNESIIDVVCLIKEMAMPDQLYRIKQFEWRCVNSGASPEMADATWCMETCFGTYYVRYITLAGGAWFWGCHFFDVGDYVAQSEEEAKKAAERHYHEKLMGALEAVSD